MDWLKDVHFTEQIENCLFHAKYNNFEYIMCHVTNVIGYNKLTQHGA